MCADKKTVQAFFDGLAASWDCENPIDDKIAQKLLSAADIVPGVTVLDVACGTGLMIPGCLERGAVNVTGVDVSGSMLAEAKKKFSEDPRVQLVRADFLGCRFREPYDRCVIFNALPHFTDHAQLLRRVADAVKTGGRLTIAQAESKAQVDAKLAELSAELVTALPEAEDLAKLLVPLFEIDVCLSDHEKYIVSGIRTDVPTDAANSHIHSGR